MKLRFSHLILLLTVLVGLIVNLLPVFLGIFPITYDQGRDFLWVKNQIDFRRPSLIGPAGSLQGVFFGPLWFWLLTLPYLISHGSPLVMTLFNALIVYSSLVLAAFIFKKFDQKISYFIIFLGFISPGIHGLANHAFSQHLLPLLTVLLIFSLTQILFCFSRWHFILACFWISLMFHAEPPISIFSIPALLIVSFLAGRQQKKINYKTIFLGIIVFIIPFLPLIIFDIRHDFLQLKSVLSFLNGNTRGLQEIAPLSFWQRLLDRPNRLFFSFKETVFKTANIFVLLVLITLIKLVKDAQLSPFIMKFLQASLIYFMSVSAIFIFYPHEFKLFYLGGLQLLYLIWMAIGLSLLWQKVNHKKYVIIFLSLVFLVNLNLLSFISSPSKSFAKQRELGSLYINQAQVIDWIYRDAAGKGFKTYIFVPTIYDYNYQYMFFWYGLSRYGYLPQEFSYWPSVPEYVSRKTEQLQRLSDKIKPAEDYLYLIVTRGSLDEKNSWRIGFTGMKLQLIDEQSFPNDTKIEKYQLL